MLNCAEEEGQRRLKGLTVVKGGEDIEDVTAVAELEGGGEGTSEGKDEAGESRVLASIEVKRACVRMLRPTWDSVRTERSGLRRSRVE